VVREAPRGGELREACRGVALALAIAVVTLMPLPAAAQERPRAPARLIAAVGDCLTAELGDTLTEPAYSEELAEGWRIVLALRGQPGMAATGLQSPPPPDDTVAAVDIYQILPDEQVPDFVDNMSAFLMVNEQDNQRYVVEVAGYVMLRVRSAASGCIERSTGGLFVFQPVP
jgi:hypothetical protein